MTNYLKKKIIYMFLEKFRYIQVYLDVCYVTLISGCFNYLQLCHFPHFFLFFVLKIAFFDRSAKISYKTVQAIQLKFLGVLYSY